MNKKLFSRRAAELSLLCGLLCSVFLSAAHFGAACDDLRSNVLRLHIIANSNSAEDQAVKLKVRDSILAQTADILTAKQALRKPRRLRRKTLKGLMKRRLKRSGKTALITAPRQK